MFKANLGVAKPYEKVAILSEAEDSDDEVQFKKPAMSGNMKPAGFRGSGCRVLSCLLMVSLAVILALSIGLLVVIMGPSTGGPKGFPTAASASEAPDTTPCLTEDCVRVAGGLLAVMNTTVNPCDDFYEYSCGKWTSVNLPPPEKAKWTTFARLYRRNLGLLKKILDKGDSFYKGQNSTAMRKSLDYYQACLKTNDKEEERMASLKKVLRDVGIGTLPLKGFDAWQADDWTFSKALSVLNGLNFDLVVGMSVKADDKNSSVNRIELSQTGLTLSSEKGYKKPKLEAAYKAYATQAIGLLSDAPKETIANLVKEVFEFEKELAAIYVPREILRQPKLTYNLMNLSDVNELMKPAQMDIRQMLSAKYDVDLTPEEVIVVPPLSYLQHLPGVLQKYMTPEKKHVLANYLGWIVIDILGPYVNDDFRSAHLLLSQVQSGVQGLSERWEMCVSHTDNAVSMAVGARFVEHYFSKEKKQTIVEMLDYVRTAYKNHFPTLSWMDQSTKDAAVAKVQAMAQKLGYPDWILEPNKLDKRYELLYTSPHNAVDNLLGVRKYSLQREMKRIGNPPDRSLWQMTPAEVNAYYEPSFNEIVFPAGVLQAPFYDLAFPMSMNFGGIGSVIGHEVSHGFDDNGGKYDAHGNMRQWWSEESAQRFKAKTKCMVDQYSSFTIQGKHVHGNLTLGENIADNGGVKISHKAYRRWAAGHPVQRPLPGLHLSQEQLFFLGFSQLWCSYYKPAYAVHALDVDPHSPNKYRVNGVMSNSAAFSKAYRCPAGSPMNPTHKCNVW